MENPNYEVSYVRISVKDLLRAREFYEEILGMQLVIDRYDDGYLLLNLGCTTLIVEQTGPENESLPPGRYLGISLKVNNVNSIYDSLVKQGVSFSSPPEKQFWGGFLTEFSDPDGNTWTLLG